jgi:hypothetical protein
MAMQCARGCAAGQWSEFPWLDAFLVIPHWRQTRVDIDESFFDESIDSLLDPISEFDALLFVELWIS